MTAERQAKSRSTGALKAVAMALAAVLLAGCATNAARGPAPAPMIEPGRDHIVRSGDTVYAIAKRYGSSPKSIRAANNLDSAYTIALGQRLRIPDGRAAPVTSRRVAADTARPTSPSRKSFRTAQATPKKRVARSAPSGAPQPMSRPTDGEIITPFGAQSGAATNDGVDIGAPVGAPVRAAADGQVAFISDSTSRLGSVVLVQHDGGMVTVYGRIDRVAVRQNQRIARGDPIAQVASPSRGGPSSLHFELRRGSEPIDPTPYI